MGPTLQRPRLFAVGAALLLIVVAANHGESALRPKPTGDGPRVQLAEGPGGHTSIAVQDDATAALTFAHLGSWEGTTGTTPPAPITAAEGKIVSLTGFMYPLSQGQTLTSFCLLRTTQTCCYGPKPQLNQYLLAETRAPVPLERLAPVTVTGRFRCDPQPAQGYIYRLEDATVQVVGSGQPDAAAWASSHGQTLWTWPLLADPGLKAEPPVVPATLRTLDGVPVVLEGYVHHRVGQELQVAATPPGGGPAPTLTTAATVVLAADQPPSQDLRGAWSGTLRLVSDASQWPDLGIVRLTDARPLPRVQVQDDRLILSVELELLAVILLLALCFGRAPAAAALLLLATALPAEDLLATVGSRAITRRQVDAAIPKDLFGPARQQARAQRLEGLVNSAATAEALVGIEPPATAIEAAYTTFLAGPFSGTCGCHVVNSYDDYKVAMLVTDADIREGIRLDLAAQQAVNQAWQSACPDAAAQAKLLAERGPALRRERIHLWQIPFYPKPGESLGTDWTTSETAQRAQAAVARLRAGTPWEQVATEAGCLGSPEHPPGDAGLVGRDDPTTLGIAVGTPPSVAPQTIVDPKPSVGGLVLLRWQDLTDAEILHLLQREVQWATRMDVAKRARAIPVVWTPAGRALRGQ